MRKIPKKVLGFIGLFLVVVMTIFAATIENPEALATSSISDTIVVRVLSGSPDVNIISPGSGSIFVSADQTIKFDYSKSHDVLVTIEKKTGSGAPLVYPPLFEKSNEDLGPGDGAISIDLSDPGYGYGEYVIRIKGGSESGYIDEDSITFSYIPVSAAVEEDDSGKISAILDYDVNSDDLDHFEINVYNKDEKPVDGLTDIIVKKPIKEVELPFAENKVPAGKYTVVVAAYNKDGEIIYETYDVVFVYEPIRVPDTGKLFGALNVSKTDFLITGFIVFFTVGIAGLVFISKGRRGSRR